MKQSYLSTALFAFLILTLPSLAKAQQDGDLIDILLQKHVITATEADSLHAAEAAKEKKKKEEENQHGITIGSKALQLSGLLQTEYAGYQQPTAINSFSLHRARLDVKGNINDNWNYEVYTEFAGTTKLLDAYTTYRIADFLKFTAGQFKVPFSLESLIADSQLEFIDRSQVVNALSGRSTDVIGNQIGRDIGIQINGSFVKIDGRYLFDYTLGVFNGAGYDVTADNNNHKDIAGRFSVHPIGNLTVSADFYDGRDVWGTPAKTQLRNRGGFDARYVNGGLSLTAEYDRGTDNTTKRDGWYAQAGYFVLPKHLQLVGRYDTYDPTIGAANVRTDYYEGALNYFFNDWAKLAINYIDRRETGTQIPNNIFETQLQLTF